MSEIAAVDIMQTRILYSQLMDDDFCYKNSCFVRIMSGLEDDNFILFLCEHTFDLKLYRDTDEVS